MLLLKRSMTVDLLSEHWCVFWFHFVPVVPFHHLAYDQATADDHQ